MGHHLYEENKRLKQEIENLRAAGRTRTVRDEREDVDTLCVRAVQAFLTGKAFLEVVPVNFGNVIYFRLETIAEQED